MQVFLGLALLKLAVPIYHSLHDQLAESGTQVDQKIEYLLAQFFAVPLANSAFCTVPEGSREKLVLNRIAFLGIPTWDFSVRQGNHPFIGILVDLAEIEHKLSEKASLSGDRRCIFVTKWEVE